MHAHQVFLSLPVLLLAASALTAPAAITTTIATHLPHVRGHLLVRVDPNQIAPLEDLARRIGVERTGSFNLVPGLDLYEFDESRSVEEVRQHFLKNNKVIYAEPDYIYWTESIAPNDPQFVKQYALDNTGQTGGSPDADINAPQMWELEKGSTDVVIATIDTGLDYTHKDLIDNVWNNPGEIPNNGKDDDNNGYIDDIHGINAILKQR